MACYRCGESVESGPSYCPNCGLDLETARERLSSSTCPECDVEVGDGACPECGLDVEEARRELSVEAADAVAGQAGAGVASAGADGSASGGAGSAEGGEGTGTDAAESAGQRGTDSAGQGSTERGGADDHSPSRSPEGAPTPEEAAATSSKSTHREGLSQDEVYCIDCGTVINRRAEMCPDCGANQVPPGGWDDGSSGQSSSQATVATAEDERIARKDLNTNVLLGIFLPPIAYLNVGKRLLAVVNLITFNYMLLGFVIVPYHVYAIIRDARHRVLGKGEYR